MTAQVVTLTNVERAKAGCGLLTANGTLTAVAQAHSQDMATADNFAHDSRDGRSPFDRMTAAGYRFPPPRRTSPPSSAPLRTS